MDEFVKPLVKSIVNFSDFVRSLEDIPQFDKDYRLNSVLLYTDEDVELAKFVRENYNELNEMSGSNINVYAIERPPDNSLQKNSLAFWKSKLDEDTFSKWSIERPWSKGETYSLINIKPYNKADAYKIARKMGIYPDQFPSIALFDNANQTNKIVIPIKSDYSKFFRNFFSTLERQLKDVFDDLINKRRLSIDKPKWDDFIQISRKKFYDSVIETLENVEHKNQVERTVYNNFYGNTVYVNHPNDKINFENFQNNDKSNNRR